MLITHISGCLTLLIFNNDASTAHIFFKQLYSLNLKKKFLYNIYILYNEWMTMFQELISNYKNSILTTGIIKIKTVYLISKSATQTRYNKKKKKTGKKKMNLKMFTINVSGNKIWQMTNGGSIGSCYSMDNVRQEKRFLVIFTWNCLDFTRSIAESIIGPRLSFKPNTVGRCRTIDCRRSRGFFFFPWEKVNRETRTRFHERYSL